MKAQIFVQGLRPDLSVSVGPFMPNSLQEAIDRSRVCEMALVRDFAVCGPASVYNTVASTVILPPLVPSVSYPLNTPAMSSTSTIVGNSVDQVVTLLQEVVSAIKNNNREYNN